MADSTPLNDVPAPPDDFGDDETTAWRRLANACIERRTLCEADLEALEGAARASGMVARLHRAIAEDDLTVPSAHGSSSRVNALVPELRAWHVTLDKWLTELGCTPATRGSVRPVTAEDRLEATLPPRGTRGRK